MAWRDDLLPGSFRGAAFYWRATELQGGRRLAEHEFPLRDGGEPEDLGRRLRHYRFNVYVVGDDYFGDRDALLAALESPGPGTLVHPYLGPLLVAVREFRLQETNEEGRIARFEIEFTEAGPPPSPLAVVDTAVASVAAATAMFAQLEASFTASFAIAEWPTYVLLAAESIVAQLSPALATLLATPGIGASSLAPEAAAITGGLLLDPASFASSVTGLFSSYASTVATTLAGFTETDSPTSSRGMPLPPDPSFGLATLAGFGSTLPAVLGTAPAPLQEAANQAALIALIQGSAVAALATVYANTAFASETDADTARDQLGGFIDAQSLAAANLPDDAAYQAWQSLYQASANDLSTRGTQLPDVLDLTFAAPVPALSLAYRLYQDATRAPELIARNDPPCPLFLPLQVEALSS